jgi:hypothetical protein
MLASHQYPCACVFAAPAHDSDTGTAHRKAAILGAIDAMRKQKMASAAITRPPIRVIGSENQVLQLTNPQRFVGNDTNFKSLQANSNVGICAGGCIMDE